LIPSLPEHPIILGWEPHTSSTAIFLSLSEGQCITCFSVPYFLSHKNGSNYI
jgi:hypothetical protein